MRLGHATLVALLSLAGCSDDPPSIRSIQYTPNAGLVGVKTSINGTVAFTDSDGDISQSQIQLFDPTCGDPSCSATSSMIPISNVNQGPIGMVSFCLEFTPQIAGNWNFSFWIIDLKGRQSNVLSNNLIRVSNP